MGAYRLTAIIDGARASRVINAYDYAEAECLYYDTVRSEHDGLIAIDVLDEDEPPTEWTWSNIWSS